MTHIEIKGFDNVEYVVHAVPWIVKNDLRIECTTGSLLTGDTKFDTKKYIRGMIKACVTVNGKALTDAEVDKIDGKTGDAIDRAIFMLNELSRLERQNLLQPPEPKVV